MLAVKIIRAWAFCLAVVGLLFYLVELTGIKISGAVFYMLTGKIFSAAGGVKKG